MLFIFKNIRRFYRSVLASTGVCFLYNLGIQKGNQLPVNTIQESYMLDKINSYIESITIILKGIPHFIYDLTTLNYGILATVYYILVIIIVLILTYFIISLYSFIINLIDKTFLKKYDFPVCNKCKKEIDLEILQKDLENNKQNDMKEENHIENDIKKDDMKEELIKVKNLMNKIEKNQELFKKNMENKLKTINRTNDLFKTIKKK
jgi:hypothetical protein